MKQLSLTHKSPMEGGMLVEEFPAFTNLRSEATLEVNESSSPGEFHPQALTDPDVTVSRHPALIIQLPSPATLPYPLAPPISG